MAPKVPSSQTPFTLPTAQPMTTATSSDTPVGNTIATASSLATHLDFVGQLRELLPLNPIARLEVRCSTRSPIFAHRL